MALWCGAHVQRVQQVRRVRRVAVWRGQSSQTSKSPPSGIAPCTDPCVAPCREATPLLVAAGWHASATSAAELTASGPASGPGLPVEVSSAQAPVGASASRSSSAARGLSSASGASIRAASACSVGDAHREDFGEEVRESPATRGFSVGCSSPPPAGAAAFTGAAVATTAAATTVAGARRAP